MSGNEQTVAFLTWLYQQALDDLAAKASKAGHIILPTLAVTPNPTGYSVAIEIHLSTDTAAALVAAEMPV